MSSKQRDTAPVAVSDAEKNEIVKSRGITVKRLVIFLALAFLPFYIIVPIMWAYYGEPIYASENENVQIAVYIVGVFGMMIPSFSNIITRLVTKEGFGHSFLGLHTKGKMGYWIASVAIPLLHSSVSAVLIWALFIDGMSFADTFGGITLQSIGMFLLQLAYSVICFFPAFGEEWGWRGYMMPKLTELMPKPAAVVVGGIIWGLWHAPLTVAGHNFGVGYDGYPWVGIGFMCLMCTLLNVTLTLPTEKTGSIYPAAFLHAVNNNLNMGVMFLLFGNEAAEEKLDSISLIDSFLPFLAVIAVTSAVSAVILFRKKKPSAEQLDKAA